MITKILLVLALLLAVLAVVVALRPAEFRVTRSATLAAPPAAVFAQINDLHRYAQWNPWRKFDPAMQTTFTGPAAGPGATMEWNGNRNIGAGRMIITESRPAESVTARLEFLKPFASVCQAEFLLRPEAGGTAVTWTMTGRHNFVAKAIGLFMSMDDMIGTQFELGLAELGTYAATAAGEPAARTADHPPGA